MPVPLPVASSRLNHPLASALPLAPRSAKADAAAAGTALVLVEEDPLSLPQAETSSAESETSTARLGKLFILGKLPPAQMRTDRAVDTSERVAAARLS